MEKFEKKMIYLVSGRSAARWSVGRKIIEVSQCFDKIVPTELICGGDIKGGLGYNNKAQRITSVAEYHAKWYRQISIVNFFTRSFSEIKDLYHCYKTYFFLAQKIEGVEIIWERSSRLHFAGLLIAKKKKLPCVLEWKDHLVDYKYSMFRSLALRVERWKNTTADYIAVESNVLKKQLIKEGIDGNKIYVTYNAVNPDDFRKDVRACKEVRRELGFSENDVLVGYVGSYAFYHDSIRMLKAAKILRDNGATNIKWLLIGDGKDKKLCEDFARENHLLNETVIMLPFQAKEKIPRFLSAMDVTILPGSTDIICPIKVMEYMAANSVVLVPDYECNREIIDGSNGLLFEPGNEESIAEVLVQLSHNKDLCHKLGEAARKTVVENLQWDKTYGAALKCIIETITR